MYCRSISIIFYALSTIFIVGTTPNLYSLNANWIKLGSGNWNNNDNWLENKYPNGVDDTAGFGDILNGNATILISNPITISGIFTNSSFIYTFSGSPITFDTTSGNAQLSENSGLGTTQINSNIILNKDLDVHGNVLLVGTVNGNGGVHIKEGTTTFFNTNSYAGSTIIEGNLILNNNGTFGSNKKITISGGGSCTINNQSPFLFEDIKGTGSLTFGYNSQIQFSDNATIEPAITINEGTIFTLAKSVTFENLIVANAFEKLGSGNMIFAPANSNSFDPTVPNYFTSEIFLNDGSMTFKEQLVQFDSCLFKVQEANLIFDTNVNFVAGSYPFAIDLASSNGSIQINSNFSVLEKIVGSGSLVLGSGTIFTIPEGNLSGEISGSGGILKTSSKALTLSGISPNYNGTTQISKGTLIIPKGSSIKNSAVVIDVEGVLKHNGETGPIINSGRKIVGASIGASIVNGNYTHTSSGILEIEIEDLPLQSDQVDVNGDAFLDGFIAVKPSPGIYLRGTAYEFFRANSISGTLAPIEPCIDFDLTISTSMMEISIPYNQAVLPVPLNDLPRNAKNIATALYDLPSDLSGSFLRFLQQITNLPASQFPEAIDQLGPQRFGALTFSELQTHIHINESMNHANELFATHLLKKCYLCEDQNENSIQSSLWFNPLGYYSNQRVFQNQLPYTNGAFGFTVGYQAELPHSVMASIGTGYSYNSLKWKHKLGDAEIQTIYLSPSLSYLWQYGYFGFALTGSVTFYDVNRHVMFANIQEKAHSTHKSYNIDGALEGGWVIPINGIRKGLLFSPVLQLQSLNFFEENYHESGAEYLNLALGSHYSGFLQPKILFKLMKSIELKNHCLFPSFYVGVLSNIPLTSATYISTFYEQKKNASFQTQSYHMPTHQAVIGGSVTFSYLCNQVFRLCYEASLGSNYWVQQADFSYAYQF